MPLKVSGQNWLGQIPAENRRHAHHAAGIDPVVQVAGPAGEELGDARELVGLGLGEEGLLRVQVGRAGARKELRQFGIADGRGEAQQQRRQDAEPHGAAGHRRAVERLHLEGQPEKGARRNQRHGVDRSGRSGPGLLWWWRVWRRHRLLICCFCVCHKCSFRPAAPFGSPVCHAAAAATFSVARLAACLPCTQPSVVALAPTVPHCCRRSPAREKGCFYVFLIWESSCFCAMCCRDLLRRAKVGQPSSAARVQRHKARTRLAGSLPGPVPQHR